MAQETFRFLTILSSGTGPTAGASVGFSNTVYDTADATINNGVTNIGDLISIGTSYAYSLYATTDSGVIYFNAYVGNWRLLSNTAYSANATLNNVNTSAPYTYCFLAGTGIATPEGEVPVEYLKIGDMVSTADGQDVPVRWIGEQRVRNWMFTPESQTPVCIAQDALGTGVPHTDLCVSADHGMVVDDYLINASALVNSTSIRFVPMAEMPPEFIYYHIETEAHCAVIANGAAAETFIDAAGRSTFDNHQEYRDLYGAVRVNPEMGRPRISSARLVPDSVKARLAPATDWDAALEDPAMTVKVKRGAA